METPILFFCSQKTCSTSQRTLNLRLLARRVAFGRGRFFNFLRWTRLTKPFRPTHGLSKEVDIVDPYFDLRPAKGNYLATLVSLLARLAGAPGQTKAIRIHFRDHDTRPSAEILARDGSAQVKGLLPPGYRMEFYAWSEKLGGEDFHDRYVLTELGGIMIGAGLSADGPEESAAFTLLNFEHAQGLRSRFSDGSTVYSRVGSAVRIRDDGSTELF